jgi:hypothetical protein
MEGDLPRVVFLTQWATSEEGNDQPWTALLQDVFDEDQSMIIDARANCLIINPSWSPLGK